MKPADIIKRCRENRDANGVAEIRSKEVAVLIRQRLKRVFPGVKFSVTSDYNSVHVRWTDGPCQRVVQAEIDEYSFGGFDGMIDLAYSGANWLLPDGSMCLGSCEGTEGSMGVVPSAATDCPKPGAVLVKYGPQYVFAQRHVSDERYWELAEQVGQRYGWEIDRSRPIWQQVMPNGEYLSSLCLQVEVDALER